LVLAGAACLVFVLFGSTNSQVTDPIAQAATLSSNAGGYRMNMSMTISSSALPAPVTASGRGVVDLRDHAASMSMALDLSELPQAVQALGSSTMRMGMILDRDVIYMNFPQGVANELSNLGGKQWIKLDLAKVTGLPGLSSLGNNPTMSDPSHMLQYLRAGSDGVTAEGQEHLDGFWTTHYRAELSLDRLAANVPPAERAAAQQALSKLQQATQTHDFPVDVWVDAHRLVRRMVMSIALRLPNGPAMDEAVRVDLSHYGPQARPTPPPADQVQDLSGLANGAGGLAGGAS
jgi:hypothetical protein